MDESRDKLPAGDQLVVTRPADPAHQATTVEARDDDRDRGFSLVEVIVTIVLMSIGVAVISSGLWAAVRASSFSDEQSKVDAVVRSAAERLDKYAYLPCPADSANGGYLPIVQAAAGSVGWEPDTIEIVEIRYWLPSGTSGGSWTTTNNLSSTECSETVGLTTSKTLQRVTVRVSSPDFSYSRTIEVVKSNVRAKPLP